MQGNIIKHFILFKISTLLIVTLLTGCGSGDEGTTSEDSFNPSEKSFLYSLFQTEYLWYDQVEESVDTSSYQTRQEMINDLRYSLDKWSFVQTTQEYLNSTNQVTQGFGCYFNYAQVFLIDINSPCELAGVQRGDTLYFIDHQTVTNSNYNDARENLNVETIFTVDRDGSFVDIPITPSVYNYKVTQYQIFTKPSGVKVAHMLFNSFTSTSADEIDEAFTYFKNNNVDELIVDLRYNTGGSVTTASILMDKIGAYGRDGELQAEFRYNPNYSDRNSQLNFEQDENSLNLSRVFFLTGYYTASASELVINGLKPYMNVKLIGATTHGKPVGMRGREKSGYIYWLINFSNYNANGEGDYYNGINVDCSVSDELNSTRMDANESLLAQALYYIDNNSCY